MQALSNNLKQLRIKAGLSMRQLASAIDVPKGRYEHWENRNVEPPIEKLMRLAAFYQLSVDELLTDKVKQTEDITIEQKILSSPNNIKKAIYTLLEL